MNAKDFVLQFGAELKKYITYYEQYKELTGEQRKQRVVEIITKWFQITIDTLPINGIVKFIIKKAITVCLPHIVQVAFDLIKSKVEGITE